MAKCIGIPTAEEAELIRQRFLKEVNEHNDEIDAYRNRTWLILTVIALVVVVSVYFFHYDASVEATFEGNAIECIVCIYLIVVWFVSMGYSDEMRTDALWAHPAAYQFFKATQNMQLLKTEVRYNERTGKKDLILTLKNANNEVSYEWIYGLNSITKTDIDETTVDLNQGLVMCPYRG